MILSRTIAHTIVKHNISIDDVAEVLARYKLLALLVPIKHHLEKMGKLESSIDTLRIESPFPVSADALARILKLTGGTASKSEITINKELLAGFKARYQGKLYDGSAERIIKQLIN
jgi:F0F1-type ATP synthase delta subunit